MFSAALYWGFYCTPVHYCNSVVPGTYLSFFTILLCSRVPLFADHGRSTPRGADDPPAANLICGQETFQRDPQFHVTASCTAVDLSNIFTRNQSEMY